MSEKMIGSVEQKEEGWCSLMDDERMVRGLNRCLLTVAVSKTGHL